jgi:hypothetical protein
MPPVVGVAFELTVCVQNLVERDALAGGQVVETPADRGERGLVGADRREVRPCGLRGPSLFRGPRWHEGVASRFEAPQGARPRSAPAGSPHPARHLGPRYLEQLPRAGHPLEVVASSVFELDPGADDTGWHRPGDEELAGSCRVGDSRAEVYGDASDTVLSGLHLTGVNTGGGSLADRHVNSSGSASWATGPPLTCINHRSTFAL